MGSGRNWEAPRQERNRPGRKTGGKCVYERGHLSVQRELKLLGQCDIEMHIARQKPKKEDGGQRPGESLASGPTDGRCAFASAAI